MQHSLVYMYFLSIMCPTNWTVSSLRTKEHVWSAGLGPSTELAPEVWATAGMNS